MITEQELDQMDDEILAIAGHLNTRDKDAIDRLWEERRRLIEEVRRLSALFDQVARLSYAAVSPGQDEP